MLLADHGVAFPVAIALTGINDGGAFIDRDLLRNDAAPIIAAIAFGPFLPATQVAVKIAA